MFELHHIGYLVRNIAESAQSFAARFDYNIESEIIEDPQQTAQVQFLRQNGANHWLELISPTSEHSKLYRALQQGERLHHLCYEVADIELAANQLREQHMLPLGKTNPAVAFSGRLIAWYMDRNQQLVELVQKGAGRFALDDLKKTILGDK